jgi:hypothetical protein
MAVKPPLSRNGSDDFQTPPEEVRPLLPYLQPHWTIWERACGKGYLVDGLRQGGRRVIGTDKKHGRDFLAWQSSHVRQEPAKGERPRMADLVQIVHRGLAAAEEAQGLVVKGSAVFFRINGHRVKVTCQIV